MTGVYILLDNDYNLAKIGHTTQLHTRLNNLRSDYNFNLSESLFLSTSSPIRLEHTLHFILNEFQCNHPRTKAIGYTEFYNQSDNFFDAINIFLDKYQEQKKFVIYDLKKF